MPYARKFSSRPRKFYRRSRKGRYRRRFARKKFLRSPRSLRAGLYIPRQAYVKLPFTQIIHSPQLTSGSNYTIPIWGNGLTCPLTVDINPPQPGEKYPLGLDQYSKFYQYYRVLGASIKVQINNGTVITGSSADTANASYYCALLSAQGTPGDTNPDSNWMKMVNSTTEDLISFPGCSWRLVSGNMGSRQNVFLKRFTKTKSILGVKDMRDNEEVTGILPGTADINPYGRNPVNVVGGGQRNAWFFMLRIDPSLTTTIPAGALQIVLKVKYYVQLYGRDFNTQDVVPMEE